MSGPSAATRRRVFELDEGQCQFWCGGQPATEVSHFKHQGAGGRPASHPLNQVDNLAASCGACHNRIPPNGRWVWREFERAQDGRIGRMVITNPDGEAVPERDLWFYCRWYKKAAEAAVQGLHTVNEIDAPVGRMMSDLRRGVPFMDDPQSFEQYVASLGWDSVKANKIADVYEWADEVREGGWPRAANFAKMALLYDIDWPEGRDPADWIERAALGDSYTVLKQALVRAKLTEAQFRLFLLCAPELLSAGEADPPVLVRTKDEDKLLEMAHGLAVLKLNSLKGAVKYRRGKDGGVFNVLDGSRLELLTLAEWAEKAGFTNPGDEEEQLSEDD